MEKYLEFSHVLARLQVFFSSSTNCQFLAFDKLQKSSQEIGRSSRDTIDLCIWALLSYGFVWKCRVPHCTQWFCWSLSLRKMAISLGIYPIFRPTHINRTFWAIEIGPATLKAFEHLSTTLIDLCIWKIIKDLFQICWADCSHILWLSMFSAQGYQGSTRPKPSPPRYLKPMNCPGSGAQSRHVSWWK